MICRWNELLSILPSWMVQDVNRLGKENLQEIRLRVNEPIELIMCHGIQRLNRKILQEDINFCISVASDYSPWAASTLAKGYITIFGGHRIGVCGEAIYKDGKLTSVKNISSLCIRIARDFQGIGKNCIPINSSVVILGAPGWGKTTLLRDLIRMVSQTSTVCVIDERKELFPAGFQKGRRMDIFSGIRKTDGIEIVIRTMGPNFVAVDEITAPEDCRALIDAVGCGVKLLATAHASSLEDYYQRKIYEPLIAMHVFQTAVILSPDKSYHVERIS